MFIAIIGTRASGCSTLKNYLITSKGFTHIQLVPFNELSASSSSPAFAYQHPREALNDHTIDNAAKHLSFLTFDATPLPSPSTFSDDDARSSDTQNSREHSPLNFNTPAELLDYVTRNWRSNFVTTEIQTREVAEVFIKRPFFMLLSLDGPLLDRFRRSNSPVSFQNFAAEDDERRFGRTNYSLNEMADLVNLRVVNDFPSKSEFHVHIESLDLLNPLHLRPEWDMYFMTLASLASQRSNCMKRRVGAILVRDKRIVSTGYNGTPRGVRNCNEGGCIRCNNGSELIRNNEECVCLHAEENALLEAGRDRIGPATLYCNTCPCLKCTIKIIQTGVNCVVYNLSYKVDTASAKLFAEAGVKLRRFDPAQHRLLPFPPNENYDTSTIDMTLDEEASLTR
ncbi:cytidine deaminase-like protein [Lentinula raphanica]|nr:cytidine deaminase-like protein [Lentinula raphanica]